MTARWTYLIISVPEMSDMKKHTPNFFNDTSENCLTNPQRIIIPLTHKTVHDNDSGNVKHFKIETLFADVAVYINESGRTP